MVDKCLSDDRESDNQAPSRIGQCMALLLPLLLACSPDRPVVEAHRGAAGYFPQNGRLAVTESLEIGVEGLEFDLVLTQDGIPVLAHDPWIDPERCERIDGNPIVANTRIDLISLETLQADFLCGGLPDPQHPNAMVLAEPVMTFGEVLRLLRQADAATLVHLDIKAEDGWTAAPEVFAEAILEPWFAADLPQPFYVSAGPPETIEAFENWGRRNGHEVPTSLSWPWFPLGGDAVSQGLGAEFRATSGLENPIREAELAGADGLALYWELARRETVREARNQGLDVAIWTLNEPGLLRHHARWPVTSLISDYPLDLP